MAIWLGKAESVSDGMKKIANLFLEWWRDSPPPPIQLEEWQMAPLTDALKPFFDIVFLEYAQCDQNFLTASYAGSNCTVSIDSLSLIFDRFIREAYGMPGNAKIFTYVYTQGDHFIFYYAFTNEAAQQIMQAKHRRKANTLVQHDDLEE